MFELLHPKEVSIKLQDGSHKAFILSKFPAIAGREIVTQYPLSAMPKIGDYKVNKEIMEKLMCYVAVKTENGHIRLTTEELINNHVPDWETLGRLEIGMMEYNCSFFQNGLTSVFSKTLKEQAGKFISKILTDLLAQSSRKDAPPSTN